MVFVLLLLCAFFSIVTISYAAADPELARDIVEALVAQAQAEHLRINRTKGSHDFFENKELQLRTNLEGLEGELRDFKNDSGFADLSVQRELLLVRIGSILDDHLATQAELSSATAEVKSRQAEMASGTTTTSGAISLTKNHGTHAHICRIYMTGSGVINHAA